MHASARDQGHMAAGCAYWPEYVFVLSSPFLASGALESRPSDQRPVVLALALLNKNSGPSVAYQLSMEI